MRAGIFGFCSCSVSLPHSAAGWSVVCAMRGSRNFHQGGPGQTDKKKL